MTRQSVLERLRIVKPPSDPLGFPTNSDSAKQAHAWCEYFLDDFLFLSKLDASIDDELENMTLPENEIYVRCRGMKGLVMRGNEKGIKMAVDWMHSSNEVERIAGWLVLEYCPNSKIIWQILSPESAVELYRTENKPNVRKEIEGVFGQHKSLFAVDELCRTLANTDCHPSHTSASFALALIGDSRAIEPLITSKTAPTSIIWALGRLADEKGSDYVIQHLYLPGAPVALARIGGKKAVPALQNHLKDTEGYKIPKEVLYPKEYVDDHTDEIKLAILLLTSKDTQNDLLDIIENAKYSRFYRNLALAEISRIGISHTRARFVVFYQSMMSTALGTNCIPALETDNSVEVTNAMKTHMSVLKRLRNLGSANTTDVVGVNLGFAEETLLSALHKRIGNEVFFIKEDQE